MNKRLGSIEVAKYMLVASYKATSLVVQVTTDGF